MNDNRQVLELFEEQKEDWTQRAEDGIERYRKGDARLTVTDKEGNPVAYGKVKLNQKSHAFRFGANLFMLDEFAEEIRANTKK